MPKSFRIKTDIGINKVLPIKLDQQFDTLEILSLAVFPNDIYTRSCADFGVLCGRVFANRGFGITNARVSVFIPLDELDENNAIISTLYPYKRTEDFNEDGYKYNLLPYTQSHSGHVPVGTFPERLDALTNKSVIEVFDKYYKFTAKTNESGDFMIFGLPIGQHNIFMQVDLSDIGEFSLTPQDLVRMGRATETQIDGVKFKFSENYSELPQIVTIEKTIQVAPFFGEKDVCDHYIVRADFDLTTEAGIEFKPTSVFMGSIISHNNRKKLKKRCKVPAKAGWLCDLITGPGQIEAIRQTIFRDSNGRPILEEFTLENSGKVIDENGTWVLEVPMNLDYIYTNEDGKKVLSDDPRLGIPTKGKYRFKIKWSQSPKVGEENKRGYFLVPNVKEWGWEDSDSENVGTPTNTNWSSTSPTKFISDVTWSYLPDEPPNPGPRQVVLNPVVFSSYAISFLSSVNVESFKILILNPDTGEYEENSDYQNYIPVDSLGFNDIRIEFIPIDANSESKFNYRLLDEGQFKQECSYSFSLNWVDYGTDDMINEAVNCEDRFYKMSYNKIYTVSQLIDRFAWQTFPQKAVEIKHITETKCEGDYNPFPANDVYYRYDIMFLILSFVLNFIVRPILIAVIIIFHVLAWLFDIFLQFYPAFCNIRNAIIRLKCRINSISILGITPFTWVSCDPEIDCSDLPVNPFKNLRLGAFIYTDDGCERCKCNISDLPIPPSGPSNELAQYNIEYANTSIAPDFTTTSIYDIPNLIDFTPSGVEDSSADFYSFMPQIMAGGSGNIYDWEGISDAERPSTFLLPFATDPLYGGKVLQFSPNLPLGEKLNLFNTKMKYFDNPHQSPGEIGWSQIKVTWWPELNYSPDFGNTDLYSINNYTMRYQNENVWYMIGDNTFLLDENIYIYNNADSVGDVVSSLNGLQVKVTSANYVDSGINSIFSNSNPLGLAFVDGITILQFSSETSSNLTAPISSIVGANQQTFDFGAAIPPCWILTFTNLNDFTNLANVTGLIGQTIYISPNQSTVTYYTLDNPDVDLLLGADTEVTILDIAVTPVGGGSTSVNIATLQLPSGEIILPRTAGQQWKYRRSNGNRFSWSTVQPDPIYNIFHLDNCLVLLMESNSIETGDLFTFQDPSLSQDPNVGLPVGQINDTNNNNNFVTVKYCDPTYDETTEVGNLTTTYSTPIFERTPWVSPFKRDLEYFQAIQVIPLSAMTTNRAPLNPTGNNRFSLPWRFLDSSYGESVFREPFTQPGSFGCYIGGEIPYLIDTLNYEPWGFVRPGPNFTEDGDFLLIGGAGISYQHERAIKIYNVGASTSTTETTTFRNDFRIYRYQSEDIDTTSDYSGLGGYNRLLGEGQVVQYSPYTRAYQLASPPNCTDTNQNLIGGTTDIWSTIDTSRYKIVFMQRGVDPHSPKLRVRYDLSRLYGYENYNANNGQFIVEGEYRMNIPIQGRNQSADNSFDMQGLTLPRHCEFNSSGSQIKKQRLFYESYLYSHNNSYSGNWETNLHTYYSCLDAFPIATDQNWGQNTVLTNYFTLSAQVGVDNSGTFFVNYKSITNNTSDNLFSYTFVTNFASYTVTDQGIRSTLAGYNYNGSSFLAACQNDIACSANPEYGDFGFGYMGNVFADIPPTVAVRNDSRNNVSGYWKNEYVEGASLMGCSFELRGGSSPQGRIGGRTFYYQLGDPTSGEKYEYFNEPSSCNFCVLERYNIGIDNATSNISEFEYISPTYRTVNPSSDPEYLEWANPAHTINMSSPNFFVFRTDRLPTSTTVVQNNANGMLMHQNNAFAVFVINDEGVAAQEGGYELPDQAQAAEIDLNELPDENQAIIDSLINCSFAVNLNSYDVDVDGNPYIKPNNPFSIKGNETYFIRGMGCYNFVSVPFKSLFGVPDRINGGGGDITSAIEWTRRTVLNFSLCFEIYSHTFSNNWINGTLYHFPFQLNTLFGPDNEPVRDYCRHVVYFHEPNQTFYYRSSPWDGTDFIGKNNINKMDGKNYGNDKQLLYPTTILDMGPKTIYLQELVFSDEYDGYIVSKIPTTTFNNVTDLLNIFVLSRLVNTNFLQQLIPTNSSGNQEGADDPSVTGFFKNTRWANGEAFFNNLLPSIIDADYSQMLSINSEFGVKEYGPEVYTNNDIWFINDNNGNSVFGITLKSDNQERDYISPRRTIWNDNSVVPPPSGNFTTIPTESQKVPSYQWRILFQYDNTANDPLQYPSIFGMQSNDFWTNAPSPQANDPGVVGGSTIFTDGFFWSYYQKLDRFNDFSEYFKTDVTNITKYYKAHIINYEPVVDSAGVVILDSLGNVSAYTETANAPAVPNRRYAYTFGAPFHFYFGLIQGASAMDRFRTKYVDTNIQYE